MLLQLIIIVQNVHYLWRLEPDAVIKMFSFYKTALELEIE